MWLQFPVLFIPLFRSIFPSGIYFLLPEYGLYYFLKHGSASNEFFQRLYVSAK